MSVLDTPPPVAVEVGACRCEGSPHEGGDIVYLHAEAPPEMGLAAYSAIQTASGQEETFTRLFMVFLRYGVADWTFVDDEGRPIPVTADNISVALPWGKGGSEVANKAAELYQEAVLRPLVSPPPTSSRVTPIRGSTSASRPSSPAPRRRSA